MLAFKSLESLKINPCFLYLEMFARFRDFIGLQLQYTIHIFSGVFAWKLKGQQISLLIL